MKMAMTSVSSSSSIFVSSFRRENGRRLKGRTTAKNFVSFFGTFSKPIHYEKRGRGRGSVVACASKIVVVVGDQEERKYEVTEKVNVGSHGNVQIDVRNGRLHAQALDKTATLKVNGNVCFPGVAYVIKPEGARCEIGMQGENEVVLVDVSLENPNTTAGASADAMSEMLAKSFEMTASKEVQNALKVEKVVAARKLAIHTKDMDLPPSSSSS
jgi:hypothetical protein